MSDDPTTHKTAGHHKAAPGMSREMMRAMIEVETARCTPPGKRTEEQRQIAALWNEYPPSHPPIKPPRPETAQDRREALRVVTGAAPTRVFPTPPRFELLHGRPRRKRPWDTQAELPLFGAGGTP